MPDNTYFGDFVYINNIIDALGNLYQKDYPLIADGRRTHEQTVSFRIAMYLAKQLESLNNQLYVDCEYHGDKNRQDMRKFVNGEYIRPDIIYHNRDEQNEFCIEMKIGSMTRHDYEKINHLISEYGYREGYCISNIGKKFVTIDTVSSQQRTWKRYRFKYDSNDKKLELKNAGEI